jgi:hypothetical protein
MDVWKPQKIELGRCLQAQIGPLRLWIKRVGDELHIAVEHLGESEMRTFCRWAEAHPTDEQEGLQWSRWIVGSAREIALPGQVIPDEDLISRVESEVIQLIPVMPVRSVVVRPEVPVKIPTDKEALFFVSIPIWIRVTAGADQVILCEEPSLILSNIWFGDPMSGELCYSLRSRARRYSLPNRDSDPLPNRAVCPVQIRNAAPVQLDVERFCVPVEHLRIYAGQKQLWTNNIHITFRGDDKASHINYAESPPTFEPVGQILSEARTPLKQTLLKKSLGGFRLLGAM